MSYHKNIYSLILCNEKLCPIKHIPLTNITNGEYEIPEDTCLVLLNANYLIEKGKNYEIYSHETIFNYFVEKNITLYCDERNKDYDYDFYYVVSKSGNWYPIFGNYRIAKNKDELKKYIQTVLEYFESSDLASIHNDWLYDCNKETKEFEKKLVYQLQQESTRLSLSDLD